jgi:diguanylate cyclase (GGDEF)-like protein
MTPWKPRQESVDPSETEELAKEYFAGFEVGWTARVDRMFVWLLGAEWLALMVAAAIFSPRICNGAVSTVHPHLVAAILSGPGIFLPVIAVALLCPGRAFTRHAIAVAQILASILLIDCTGGRIESHFHIFGSLAFLACYRDWRVLVTASVVTAADHFIRGVWWPESVYGILTVSPWRWIEHTGWVLFEDFFLMISMRAGIQQSKLIARAQAALYQGASHDPLTGVANRRLLSRNFEANIAAHGERKAAVLFIDLDGFRLANETLGHMVGDRLLAEIAARLSKAAGHSATLARVGGDEFVAILDNVSGAERAQSVGMALLETVATPYDIEGHRLLMSASIGIALYPDHGTTLEELQEKADRALYVSRLSGRGRCLLFSQEVSRREDRNRELSADLSSALRLKEFEVWFQPLVRSEGRLSGFEALIRWRHRVHGMISPADFIPQAERSGLIVELGDWVLEEACRVALSWQKPGRAALGVAVNVSAIQFEQSDYPERVLGILASSGLSPSLLTLELTEGILVKEPRRTREHLMQLRRAGIRISLDDFGTGYSSLSYLTELPADEIKLDRSFLSHGVDDSMAVLESIICLAHRLNLEVVAEGIETEEQSRGLIDLKCDHFQGFYFSRPITAAEAARLVESERDPLEEFPSPFPRQFLNSLQGDVEDEMREMERV